MRQGSAPVNNIYYPDGPQVENTYAMSETGFFVFRYILDRAYDIAPLGKPTLPIDLILLKEDDTLVEGANEEGELCFVNEYIRGYINLPEQTARAFRTSPLDPDIRLFHTGDMAYRDDEGRYYIAGRIDDMIKINGNRIEPAEIERRVRDISKLEQVVAKGFQEEKRAFIVLYYLIRQAEALGIYKAGKLSCDMSGLRKYLPEYMIPAYYVGLEEFPLNANRIRWGQYS